VEKLGLLAVYIYKYLEKCHKRCSPNEAMGVIFEILNGSHIVTLSLFSLSLSLSLSHTHTHTHTHTEGQVPPGVYCTFKLKLIDAVLGAETLCLLTLSNSPDI